MGLYAMNLSRINFTTLLPPRSGTLWDSIASSTTKYRIEYFCERRKWDWTVACPVSSPPPLRCQHQFQKNCSAGILLTQSSQQGTGKKLGGESGIYCFIHPAATSPPGWPRTAGNWGQLNARDMGFEIVWRRRVEKGGEKEKENEKEKEKENEKENEKEKERGVYIPVLES